MTFEEFKKQISDSAPIILEFVVNRLKEPSTWKGLSTLLSMCGVYFNPEQWHTIVGLGALVVGLIDVLKKDASSPDSKLNKKLEDKIGETKDEKV